jgi:hypothetical protein
MSRSRLMLRTSSLDQFQALTVRVVKRASGPSRSACETGSLEELKELFGCPLVKPPHVGISAGSATGARRSILHRPGLLVGYRQVQRSRAR